MKLALVLAAAALGALRVAGHTGEAFQAVAHCFVGGLLGAWLALRPTRAARLPLALAVALSALETACFLLGVGR